MSAPEVVLGGGVAGLVWAWAHPGSVVVAEKPGGAMASRFPIGPRYLHATPAVEAFLASVDMEPGERVVVAAAGVEERDAYSLKTRGVAAGGLAGDAPMTLSHAVFATPTPRQLTERLLALLGDRIVRARATQLDADRRVLRLSEAPGRLEYDLLVSTIPLPWLAGLLSSAPPFGGVYASVPVRFDFHRVLGPWPWAPCEYVYVADLDVPYSRISLVPVDGYAYACFEYPGVDAARAPAASGYVRRSGDMLIGERVETVTFPFGRVVSRPVPPATRRWLAERGVSLFGRFAEWEDWTLTHDLIARVAP